MMGSLASANIFSELQWLVFISRLHHLVTSVLTYSGVMFPLSPIIARLYKPLMTAQLSEVVAAACWHIQHIADYPEQRRYTEQCRSSALVVQQHG
jgi:hypothetical protein